MGRTKKNGQPKMIEVELYRFYKIIRYELESNNPVEVTDLGSLPDKYDYGKYEYEYEVDDFMAASGGEIYDVKKFIEIFNSIPEIDKYTKITLSLKRNGYYPAYPTLIGFREETPEEVKIRIEKEKEKKEKKELAKQKREKKALEKKKKLFQQLKKELSDENIS